MQAKKALAVLLALSMNDGTTGCGFGISRECDSTGKQ